MYIKFVRLAGPGSDFDKSTSSCRENLFSSLSRRSLPSGGPVFFRRNLALRLCESPVSDQPEKLRVPSPEEKDEVAIVYTAIAGLDRAKKSKTCSPRAKKNTAVEETGYSHNQK